MTEANDQPTPFDQDLYDRVIAAMPQYMNEPEFVLHGGKTAYRNAASASARIAAERAKHAPVPSDEAIGLAFGTFFLDRRNKDMTTYSPSTFAAFQDAVREALTAAIAQANEENINGHN